MSLLPKCTCGHSAYWCNFNDHCHKKVSKNMSYTTDRNDPRLGRGVDNEKTEQHEVYLILSDEERAKGFVRPVRKTYVHTACGGSTTMGDALAETYARDPKFYGATYCVHCKKHLPVDEFFWDGTNEKVGS